MMKDFSGDRAALEQQSLVRNLADTRPDSVVPAADLLGNLGRAARAVFDQDFYVVEYPDVAAAGIDPFEHYIKKGRFEWRKASFSFDPARYVVANPEIAKSKLEPFLHYVLIGRTLGLPLALPAAAERLGLSLKEWTAVEEAFDPEFYLAEYSDVTTAGTDPLEHYLAAGRFEDRKPFAEFSPARYAAANPEVAKSELEPFLHYALIGRDAGLPRSLTEKFSREIGLDDELRGQLEQKYGLTLELLRRASESKDFARESRTIEESGLFESAFYCKQVPCIPAPVTPLIHFLVWGAANGLNPSARFNTAEYLVANPDVRNAGVNPLLHYLDVGRAAQRPLTLAERNLRNSRLWNFSYETSLDEEAELERIAGKAFFCRYSLSTEQEPVRANALRAIGDLATRKPALEVKSETIDVSILIPVHGQLQYLLSCLDSLSSQVSRFSAEIMVLDDASPASTSIGKVSDIPWLRYVRLDTNKGFLRTCNYGASLAKGRFLVLLNSDTRLVSGWLDELIDSFSLFPKAGLIGSKLLNEDGSLQEAGGIVFRNQNAWNFGRNQNPWRPEYCHARQVDYCSGASIAVPSAVWRELGGFDPQFAPAYYEDTDLAFRLRERGYETWLQPLSIALHYEGKSHGRDVSAGIKAHQVVNAEKFFTRWQPLLRDHGHAGMNLLKMSNRRTPRDILILDEQMPTPDRDSGSHNTFEVIRIFQHLGWRVSFAPRNFFLLGHYGRQLQRLGVETLVQPFFSKVEDILERPHWDVIFAFRFGPIARDLDRFREVYPEALVIFHDIDIHYLRTLRKAQLQDDHIMRTEAELIKDQELEVFAKADCSVVVTEAEKKTIEAELPVSNIVVYPYTTTVRRSAVLFSERKHICFVGGFAHDPNVDAVEYFVREIWPRARPGLPAGVKFLVIGPGAPEQLLKLAADDVEFLGFVPELAPIFDQCRLAVAPLRYGAGIKGKLVASLAHGLPAVATSLAVEGMGLAEGKDVLAADEPDEFAQCVMRLYEDAALWERIQGNGYAFVEQHYSWKGGVETVKRILRVASETWTARHEKARREKLDRIFDDLTPPRTSDRNDLRP